MSDRSAGTRERESFDCIIQHVHSIKGLKDCVAVSSEESAFEWFGEKVGNVEFGGDGEKLDLFVLDKFAEVVIPHADVFGSFVGGAVFAEVDASFVVFEDGGGLRLRISDFGYKSAGPSNVFATPHRRQCIRLRRRRGQCLLVCVRPKRQVVR